MGLFRGMRPSLGHKDRVRQPDAGDISREIAALHKRLDAIMATLEETLAAVQAETTSENSLIALVVGLKKQIDAALAGQLTPSQQMRLDAIFNQATANKAAIDAAVTANTPAAGDQTGATTSQSATSTSVTSSLNPANVGTALTLSAAVTSSAAGHPITGTVTFTADGNVLGVATLGADAVAQLASSAFAGGNLPLGDHQIEATYGGDANYASSVSPPLDQSIIATPPANAVDAPPAAAAAASTVPAGAPAGASS